MNKFEPSVSIVDPEDPLFKSLRHRFYKLGKWKKGILVKLFSIDETAAPLDKGTEKWFLLKVGSEGRIVDLLKLVEQAEMNKAEFDKLNQAQKQTKNELIDNALNCTVRP